MCVGSWFVCIGLCAFVCIKCAHEMCKVGGFRKLNDRGRHGNEKGGIGESGRTIMETSSRDPELPPFKPYPTNGTFNDREDL